MSEYVLPLAVPPIGNYDFGTTIDNIGYVLKFQWNTKDNAWYFSVYDANANAIRTGIKVVLGAFLGKTCQHPLFNNGVFVAVDTGPDNIEPGFNDFGTRVVMKYIDAIDLVQRIAP